MEEQTPLFQHVNLLVSVGVLDQWSYEALLPKKSLGFHSFFRLPPVINPKARANDFLVRSEGFEIFFQIKMMSRNVFKLIAL